MYSRHKSRVLTVLGLAVFLWVTISPFPTVGQEDQWTPFIQKTLSTAYTIVHTEKQEFSSETRTALQEILKTLETQWVIYQQGGICPSEAECLVFQRIIVSSKLLVKHPQGADYTTQEWESLATLRQVLNFYGASPSPEDTAQDPLAIADPISLTVQYQYRSDPDGDFKTLDDDGVMHSGDYYQIIFAAGEPCYVYLFQVDAAGRMFGLFPLERFKEAVFELENPVQPDTIYTLPSSEDAFVLDTQTGEETIYLLAFRETQPKLDQLHEQMVAAQNAGNPTREEDAKRLLLDQFHSKGVARTAPIHTSQPQETPAAAATPVSSNNDILTVMQQKLDMCDGCVHRVTFQHK